MPLYVVDANVVVKWFTAELHSQAARRLLNRGNRFAGPDFLPTEVMNVMLRKHRKGEVTLQNVLEARNHVRDAFDLIESEPLLDMAVGLSLQHQRDAFDGVYVAVAIELRCQFVTADGPLFRSLASRHLETMLWVEDIPE